MKTIKITIIFLLVLCSSYGQLPSQDLVHSYETEMTRFNLNIEHYNSNFLACYNDFYPILSMKTLRIMESKRDYNPLVPIEFDFFMKIANKVVPGSAKVSKIFTELLEKGWTAHNNEIEKNRKKNLVDGHIKSYLKNMTDKNDFIYTMGPFLTRGNQSSDFQVKINKIFYQNNQKKAEQIWEELYEINERLEKHPIFSYRGSNAQFIAKKMFYEDYIMQFANYYQNELTGTTGSLIAYIEFDDNFKLVNKTIVPKVPAGWEIGQNINTMFSKEKKRPLDLKVIKTLCINSAVYDTSGLIPKTIRDTWYLTLDINNQIPWKKVKENFGFPESLATYIIIQPSIESKHAQAFLKRYGKKDKSGLWSIKRSLFKEFTKVIPKNIKKMPNWLREMIEL